jgi:putative peptide zinc metalloprotease protein
MSVGPRLRADIAIVEQVYRGEKSFVVKDLAAQKYFRFGAAEVRVMRCFDGKRSPAQIAEALGSEGLRISASTVEAFAQKLANAGFLERTLAERTTLQIERLRAERNKRHRPQLFRGEWLRMRWSFGDPDSFMNRTLPRLRWMFTRGFAAVSVALFAAYLYLLSSRWAEFKTAVSASFSLSTITIANVLTLWVVGGVVILIHELGHGYMCKFFGGEVRELGFMLLYFQPSFYCNVSDAWSFPERRARMWVTAAGMWIQLVIASVAAIAWGMLAPGTWLATAAIATMIIGGVSTIVTNANPLLPLDGYFALTDWLEIPNLRHRALAHFRWWIQQRVLRIDAPEPPATARERKVFLIYGALSAAYITLLFGLLAALLFSWAGRQLGTIGVIAAVVLLLVLLRSRLAEWGRGVILLVRTRRSALVKVRRPIAIGMAVVLLAMILIPWTLTSSGSMVVSPVATSRVNAAAAGVVAEVLVSEGMRVEAGAPLARLANPALDLAILEAARAVDSLTALEVSVRSGGRADESSRVQAERESAAAALAALERQANELTLRAPIAGAVVTHRPEEALGRSVSAGDSLFVLATIDSVELRVELRGAGATRVSAGQILHAVSYADIGAPWSGTVGAVSTAGVGGSGFVEARATLAADGVWRAGAVGEASVELARSNLFGAAVWRLRQLIRTDLWL